MQTSNIIFANLSVLTDELPFNIYIPIRVIKSIKLRFIRCFCKSVVKIGLKTWLNIDLSISILCLYPVKPRDAFIAFYPLYRLTLIQTELHEYVSKAQYTKVWTLRWLKLLSYNSIFFRLIDQCLRNILYFTKPSKIKKM